MVIRKKKIVPEYEPPFIVLVGSFFFVFLFACSIYSLL